MYVLLSLTRKCDPDLKRKRSVLKKEILLLYKKCQRDTFLKYHEYVLLHGHQVQIKNQNKWRV